MRTNKELMNDAKGLLQGQWMNYIGAGAIYLLIVGAASSCTLGLGSLVLYGPLEFGFTAYMISASRRENPEINKIFSGFNRFGDTFFAGVLTSIFIFLWSLLLIVPGIIAAMRYSMTFYILCDNPEMSASEAIDKSCEMMNGYKWSFFCLNMRFLGWILLACIFTAGLGMFVLVPYMQMAYTLFYEQLKTNGHRGMQTPPPVM